MADSRSPIGQPTRGKTARNRLRRVDIFLSRYDPGLLRRRDGEFQDAIFVDLGFGAEPSTTHESSQRFRKINPDLVTIGVEIDPERVSAALPNQTSQISFRHGGFNLPMQAGETIRLLRAFNVLRQYSPEQVRDSLNIMAAYMLPGSLIIEGTSDPFGRIWTANLFRIQDKDQIEYEGITFSANLRHGFDPAKLQAVLPKNLISRMGEPTTISQFMTSWKDAAARTIGFKEFSHRDWFVETAIRLANHGYKIDQRKKMLKSGFLTWYDPDLPI